MPSKIKTGKDLLTPILDRIKDSANGKSTIGIHSDEDGEVLLYATLNEFGGKAEAGNFVPSRPFIRQTFDKYKQELVEVGNDLYKQIILGTITKKQALFAWGQYLETMIQKEINEGTNFKENAEYTIEKKGEGKNPLQDTGALQRAIKTVVTI